MRRVALLSLLVVVVVAAGCGTLPPPGWEPPNVQTPEISTNEIVAGSTFTVSVVVTDDESVDTVGFRFLHAPFEDTLRVPCDVAEWEPGPVVTVEATCTMPAVAPNGAWRLQVLSWDASGVNIGEGSCSCGGAHTSFTVSGGTEDRQDPVIHPVVFSPEPIAVGTPFTATIRVSEDHPWDWGWVLYYTAAPGTGTNCVRTSHTALSPSEYEFVLNCPAALTAGAYTLQGVVQDEIGYHAVLRAPFVVVAP